MCLSVKNKMAQKLSFEKMLDVGEDVLGLCAWFVELNTLFAFIFIYNKFTKVVGHILAIELGSVLSQALVNWMSISAIDVNFFEHWEFDVSFISRFLNLLWWSRLLLVELIAWKC